MAEAARRGDRHALRIWREAGDAIGRAVVQAATVLDVTTVVVAGSVARSWDLLQEGFDAAVERMPPISGAEVEILPSRLGSSAVLLGAASLCLPPTNEESDAEL